MERPAKPDNEAERLRVLHRYAILDTGAETAFDDLVAIAAAICGTPMGSISLIDADRQWFKARIGLDDAETGRDIAFCAHAILEPERTLVVPDAQLDARFRDNPAVTGDPGIRFYAGAPLLSAEGLPMGTLCVMDHEPRELRPFQRTALDALSRQVAVLMELRRVGRDLKLQLEDREWYEEQLSRFNEALELKNADLTQQARVDELTGLANRRALGDALERMLAERAPFCVALMDVDHFKDVNDTYGHAVGDQVLAQVADCLRSTSAGSGLLARYGGEEFAWLMPGDDLEAARARCDGLRDTVAYASQALPVTVSIGLACAKADDTIASVLHRADQALYTAKRTGRDRVVSG